LGENRWSLIARPAGLIRDAPTLTQGAFTRWSPLLPPRNSSIRRHWFQIVR
jgi:hypothetical protein